MTGVGWRVRRAGLPLAAPVPAAKGARDAHRGGRCCPARDNHQRECATRTSGGWTATTMSRRHRWRPGEGTAWLVADRIDDDYRCYLYAGTNDDHLVEQARAATAVDAVAWGRRAHRPSADQNRRRPQLLGGHGPPTGRFRRDLDRGPVDPARAAHDEEPNRDLLVPRNPTPTADLLGSPRLRRVRHPRRRLADTTQRFYCDVHARWRGADIPSAAIREMRRLGETARYE